jgi:formylglycine-generating enzyme required for sulfatase activity
MCDPADSICKKPAAIDGGLLAPVVSGIDGDGTESPVVCPDAGPCNISGVNKAQHRFRNKWLISGLRLDTVSDAKLEGPQNYSVQFETGGTPMKRNLLLPITLTAGMFTLTLTNAAGDATADTYILQGEQGIQGQQGIQGVQGNKGDKGDPGTFTGSFTGDVTFTGNMSLTGTATLANLNVTGTYLLPDCPEGYTKDVRTDITLCKKGLDEMVRVGDFWIDRYEGVIVDETAWNDGNCNGAGNAYGNDADNYPTLTFPYTGNWTQKLYACSRSGLKPSRWMTWFQAQEAAVAAGKRLCTNEEWQAAVSGTSDPGANPGSGGSPTANTKCVTDASGPRNTGLAGSVPGGNTSCISSWGMEDGIGNLWEWVAMWGQSGAVSTTFSDGAYAGNVTSNNGFANFSPETSGDGDGTWNLNGKALGCDRTGGNCGYKVGLPFAAIRGGGWSGGSQAGAFALDLDGGPSYRANGKGFRACRGR